MRESRHHSRSSSDHDLQDDDIVALDDRLSAHMPSPGERTKARAAELVREQLAEDFDLAAYVRTLRNRQEYHQMDPPASLRM